MKNPKTPKPQNPIAEKEFGMHNKIIDTNLFVYIFKKGL